MDNDYYSIESILAENQKIQCTFKIDIPDLGHLDGGSEKDIKAGTKAQLPLWLAPILLFSDFADGVVPPPFTQRVKNALKAEPRSVQLSSLVGSGGQWYWYGRIVANILLEDQSKGIIDSLTAAFQDRLVDVMDQAQHFGALGAAAGGAGEGQSGKEFREGLDATERELFSIAQESAKQTKQWYESSDKTRRL